MAFFVPSSFQGNFRKHRYFEEWYCTHICAPDPSGGRTSLIIVPGISLGPHPCSFIQIIAHSVSGPAGRWCVHYPIEAARLDRRRFDVVIGDSRFSLRGAELRIRDPSFVLDGSIEYRDPVRYPVTLARPGIMGPYRYLLFVPSHIGIVSAHHGIAGEAVLRSWSEDLRFSFDGGSGFIGKDWGTAVPASWVVLNALEFSPSEISLSEPIDRPQEPSADVGPETPGAAEPVDCMMISIARTRWCGRTVTVFTGYIRIGGSFVSFAPYTGARIAGLEIRGPVMSAAVLTGDWVIRFRAARNDGKDIFAPADGAMSVPLKQGSAAYVEAEFSRAGCGRDFASGAAIEIRAASSAATIEAGGSSFDLRL